MTDAQVTAEKLLQAGAVRLSPEAPFTWASGWKSPIYCDNRKLLSQPYIRDYIKSELSNLAFTLFPGAELVAGVATAGIPWGALVADALKLPLVYVRPKPKTHGMGNQIEGGFNEGMTTVVVEDLISTGGSSLEAVKALQRAGLKVEGVIAVFSYGFGQAEAAFREAGLPLHTLTNYEQMIRLALQKGIVKPEEEQILLNWRQDPSAWTGKTYIEPNPSL